MMASGPSGSLAVTCGDCKSSPNLPSRQKGNMLSLRISGRPEGTWVELKSPLKNRVRPHRLSEPHAGRILHPPGGRGANDFEI